jgi:hypothetical protein
MYYNNFDSGFFLGEIPYIKKIQSDSNRCV